MRLLVCGDRLHKQFFPIDIVLTAFLRQNSGLHLITGGCRGVDTFAAQWSLDTNVPCTIFSTEGSKYGKAAGPIRNRQMLIEGKPNFVLAFHPNLAQSKGTLNMVSQAKKAGVPALGVNAHGQLYSL